MGFLMINFKKIILILLFAFFSIDSNAFFNLSMLSKNKSLSPQPRLISNSYYSDYNGPVYKSSAGMSISGFEISTSGVVNGDLLLIIASIDNGSDTLWPNPIASGFTQLYQKVYGNDGETFMISWKIANNEPVQYNGVYGPGIISGSAAITLLAISGANNSTPINATNFHYDVGVDTAPVVSTSTGVTTTVNNCTIIYASGVDWVNTPGSSVFTQPAGYSMITHLGDNGTDSWDWTSQQVSYLKKPTSGATGALSSIDSAGVSVGIGWSAVIAIAPP